MKAVLRRAKLSDVDAIVDLSVESVQRNPLPVKIDREAMKETARSLLNPAHFLWVSELNGEVVASVAACVEKSFWYRGLQCSVMLYYGRKPNACLPLLRELAKWMKSRSGIKVGVMELEPEADPRILRALHRMGFSRESMNVCYVRPSA